MTDSSAGKTGAGAPWPQSLCAQPWRGTSIKLGRFPRLSSWASKMLHFVPCSHAFAETIQRKEDAAGTDSSPDLGRVSTRTLTLPHSRRVHSCQLAPRPAAGALELNGNWKVENSPLRALCPQQGDGSQGPLQSQEREKTQD